jgi:hypothetical protein
VPVEKTAMKKGRITLFIFSLIGLFPLGAATEDAAPAPALDPVVVQSEDLGADLSYQVQTSEPTRRNLASEELRDFNQEKMIENEIKYWKYEKK